MESTEEQRDSSRTQQADDAPEGRSAPIISGDSQSLHFLVNQLDRRPFTCVLRRTPANAELEKAVFAAGKLKPREILEKELFPVRTPNGRVTFEDPQRLLSKAEQRAAVEAFQQIALQGHFTSGPHVARFEQALADFSGLPWAIGTSSGTDGLVIALRALGLTPGDEVVIPANSFAATENAILACGGVPVLADICGDGPTLAPADLAAKITPRTKAVVPVHLYGELARMEEIAAVAREHGIAIVEDACQAVGVTGVGVYSDAAILSFNPHKNFGLCGKAGAILTENADIAALCRMIGYHGFRPGGKNVKQVSFGLNAGIDNMHAAIGLALFPHLTLNNFRRTLLAKRYTEALFPLQEAGAIRLPAFAPTSSWHLFPIQALRSGRDELARLLSARWNVEAAVFYPVLTHQQDTPLLRTTFAGVSLPRTELFSARQLCLPLFQHMSLAEQDRVIAAVFDVYS
ncbi:DegT/DnrJ/EryC1/StrS family aminotransferase [Paractinoplanes hotanensis]|uniref:DegT/DnrJ/EryC1/StrS family aminotransferase n=1 Tax=Paractinoplanes hotanensis TaxID=2906497 RepID=A0ABT0XY47_9ACTN|nr:DegT/DnrJ/EryC1/StrS family aminotransferase [Actinoplanes hotanensis]MCM4078714.1 DegT/DnrJ/EryC1/StrS family aminotransferase [Actinoplanes hotanensis]